ncbi:hypothetical protein SKAU_G00276400 [Synaphobranchus kaupii]|uniref:Uncharacterized protein n=1 Tax=Synaphobranchus kaupii TaxID=118154 RepID=A0A9Q1IR43_SYNKA|nr:hypothetical protein SKAU_G00275670 [Synaphobranchus kaupii]KAJ8349051.1 hypothetical protein SKAU_G00276400 [Synaphobranchus kaupii]
MQENVWVSSAIDETVPRSITPEQPVGEALAEPGEETSKQASGAEVINETGAEIASEVGAGEPSQTEQASGSLRGSPALNCLSFPTCCIVIYRGW